MSTGKMHHFLTWRGRCAALSAALLIPLGAAFAAKTWSFNWYCSGCARIGARTTGTNGPFPTRESCEAARSSMQSAMDSRGGGVNTVSCTSVGFDDPPPQQPTYNQPSGANFGGGYQPPPSYPSSQNPPIDYQAQQRQRAAEEEKNRALERARQAAEFEKDKQTTLDLLKGAGSGGELKLKGLEDETRPALKDARDALASSPTPKKDANSGLDCARTTDASVVNLCNLKLDKPIKVDIQTVQGQRQVAIALITLHNPDYVAGFEAIRARNYSAAIERFAAAEKKLGNDYLVYMGKLLAQDLQKVEQKKRDPGAAQQAFKKGLDLAIFNGDYDGAARELNKAIQLDPSNTRYPEELKAIQSMSVGADIANRRNRKVQQRLREDIAFELAEKAFRSMVSGRHEEAIATLKAADVVHPNDALIRDLLGSAQRAQKKAQRQ